MTRLPPPLPPRHAGIARQLFQAARQLTPVEFLGWSIAMGGMGYLAACESRRIGQKRDAVTFCQKDEESSSSMSSRTTTTNAAAAASTTSPYTATWYKFDSYYSESSPRRKDR
mmetsp:Transcript_14717/g.29943  ORF Transcript_14717/g.29943 Transcript_14717/m.29943 type:complete len:113 (-) Transcript_14717:122-460(-)